MVIAETKLHNLCLKWNGLVSPDKPEVLLTANTRFHEIRKACLPKFTNDLQHMKRCIMHLCLNGFGFNGKILGRFL